MATEQERQLLAESVLRAIGSHAERLPASPVTGFLAMAGDLYDGRLMVVGRAVNGWTQGLLPAALASDSAIADYAEIVFTSVRRSNGCPMRWVTDCWGDDQGDYNTKRSAFWRVIRGVVAGLRIADVEDPAWPSRLVWSNLYKVAPADGGNPSNTLCDIQLGGCIDLFQLELRKYKPSRLLLLTGHGWASPFLQASHALLQTVSDAGYVEGIGTIPLSDGQVRLVVAAHPQATVESEWTNQVLAAYDR